MIQQYPSAFTDMIQIKAQIEEELRKEIEYKNKLLSGETKIVFLDLLCSECKEQITNKDKDHYYRCIIHKTIFCDFCARNSNKKEIERCDAPKCKQSLIDRQDCIYEKVLF